ncbi:polyphosphate kinase 2 family protein [Lentisphaerota bacterium ZTH]|nr:polyphosphate kinase 2 family protein [Lentisphaerota bacterium]WET06907.1 polyphosphate kinase 2 family protein [Lentisphaerota bacterium ZTH]
MDYRKKFLVKPGGKVKLDKVDPDFTDCFESKEDALELLEKNTAKLAELQYKLYSENKQSLLIVLQAMDAGGKDGTIKHVMGPMNPQSCRVHSYKQPSPEELDHDFLWRIHRFAPRNGEVVIYNRSHYEDVLVVRVHNLVSREIWSRRYEFINDFEKMLSFHKVKIVKFFLHISRDEQLKRFRKRLERPDKQWKISECDYKERQYWHDYIEAFEDAMNKCSTNHAPWYVIPANHKWFRNLAVSQILIDTMEDMNMKLPEPEVDIEHIRLLAIAEEEKARNSGKH